MKQIALIGCSHIHTPNFLKTLAARNDLEVKYIWDQNKACAKKTAENLPNAKVIKTADEAYKDKEISAVIICSETNIHEKLVVPAAKAKKHLFVEKPLGMGAKDSYHMAKTIEKKGIIFQTGYFFRGKPVHLFLKEAIQKGYFGKITRIRHSTCHSGSLKGWFDTEWRWMADLEKAGVGAFGDLGTHSLDILLWLMGEVESVTASIHVATGRYGDCDEYGEGLIHFKNGAVGSLAAGWVDVAHPISCIISGTEGHAYVSNGQLFFQSSKVDGADGKTPWTALPTALPHAFDLFLDAVVGIPNQPLVSASEAAYCCAVMKSMYKSSKSKKWQTVE